MMVTATAILQPWGNKLENESLQAEMEVWKGRRNLESCGCIWTFLPALFCCFQTHFYIRSISYHLKFAVTWVYHISDTFAFSVSVIHREAALGEHPQSLLLFSEMCSSPHACPHLLLREFSPHSLLDKQWTTATVDGVSGLNPTQPDSLPENFNWAQRFVFRTHTGINSP